MVVVVVVRRVKEDPELGPHNKGATEAVLGRNSIVRAVSPLGPECQGWKEFGLSTQGTGSHQAWGWDGCGQLMGRWEGLRW